MTSKIELVASPSEGCTNEPQNPIRNYLAEQIGKLTSPEKNWGLNSRIKRTFTRP